MPQNPITPLKREIVEKAKIVETEDHSEIKMNIGLLRGKVVINFGKLPITWIELTKEQALEVAKIIEEKANILKPI